MYTVLLPVDMAESRATAQVETAIGLPNANEDVDVKLLHVFREADRAEEASPLQLRAGEHAYERLEEAGLSVEPVTRYGDPASGILEAAADYDADMILLGGRKRSPLGSVLFGSVSQEVTLDAERPVVVTGDREQQHIPSHRCQSCGEEYYTDDDLEIPSCRNCGGTKVERVGEQSEEPAPTA
ncbi:UspA domain-containing protein [Halosimplex carlsbadense 2-9-1]|uniref:UspA domain-containing protein n=1 Tax=Halosimplex carlsbadense 2-9-1 TaxID=797114 RepID=M0D2F1_9EURY|nr:universal stress protein [Halosimplex carlsbadense]ELZ28877.1 UspA domain-containing protein [Halosimplex carlsbadense 2-9-1]